MASCEKKDYSNDFTEPKGGFTQLNEPKNGDQIAIIKTNMGDVTIVLFPQYAPKTVENFTTHAKNGYYDGVIFHRVIEDFMIQGGDPTGTGYGGESIWGKAFDDECTPQLHNIRGALSMANAGWNTNGSQFFIVQNTDIGEDAKEMFQYAIDNPDAMFKNEMGLPYKFTERFPVPFLKAYVENGGSWVLDYPGYPDMAQYRHTVFGQVIDGMDVVDRIAAVETDENDKPLEDVIILSISVEKYKK